MPAQLIRYRAPATVPCREASLNLAMSVAPNDPDVCGVALGEATFHSTAVVGNSTSGLTVLGELSIKECTRPGPGGRRASTGSSPTLGASSGSP
jgi:hypothetical protein